MLYKVFEYNNGVYDIRYCHSDTMERTDGEHVTSFDEESEAYRVCNALNVALIRGGG